MAYHWKDGWYFERIIEPNSWASIVASVSPEGETGFTFELAKALHGVLSYME